MSAPLPSSRKRMNVNTDQKRVSANPDLLTEEQGSFAVSFFTLGRGGGVVGSPSRLRMSDDFLV